MRAEKSFTKQFCQMITFYERLHFLEKCKFIVVKIFIWISIWQFEFWIKATERASWDLANKRNVIDLKIDWKKTAMLIMMTFACRSTSYFFYVLFGTTTLICKLYRNRGSTSIYSQLWTFWCISRRRAPSAGN